MSTCEWKLVNAALPLLDEGRLYSLTVRDGMWQKVEPQERVQAVPEALSVDRLDVLQQGGRTVDLGGKLLLPGLVDAHMHLDKSFSLPRVGNVSGTLEEAVQNYSDAVKDFPKEEIKARIMRSALQAMSFGTTAIRTHLDFHVRWGADVALRTVEAALEAKEELAPYLELQLFPLAPFFRFTKAEVEVLEEAVRMGMTGVGSAPHLSPTPESDIDSLFALAEKYGIPLDFHTDESDDPGTRTLAYITKRTLELGWSGRVAVDHLCSLAAMPDRDAAELIEGMVRAKLYAVTLPGANLYLQGRRDSFPVRRGVTRVKELLAAGVPVAAASDNIHDPFHPFGRGDLVQIGLITAYAAHMGSPAEIRRILRMMTEIPAAMLGLEGYGIQPGNAADFVILDARTPEELFTMLPERRWIYRKNRWLRTAAPRAEWNLQLLNVMWDEAAEKLSFGGGRPALRA